jgi:hypothetical protein
LHGGPRTAHALDLVVAFATGPYSELRYGDLSGSLVERAYWIQLGIDYELVHSGFHFATGIGIAVLAGTSNVQRTCETYCPASPSSVFPTTHVTLGFGI